MLSELEERVEQVFLGILALIRACYALAGYTVIADEVTHAVTGDGRAV
jgi:hypothetical protein